MPIWLDLVSSPPEWSASFLSPEAREVLSVLGGLIVVFGLPSPSLTGGDGGEEQQRQQRQRQETKDLIAHVGRVLRDGLGGWEWDGVGLAVGISSTSTTTKDGGDGEQVVVVGEELDEWEDCCAEWGLEFVHFVASSSSSTSASTSTASSSQTAQRNEFGEKTGIPRVLEALEANDWTAAALGGDDDQSSDDDEYHDDDPDRVSKARAKVNWGDADAEDEDDENENWELDPRTLGFGFDREDFVGLRQAIYSGGSRVDDDDDDNNGKEEEKEKKGQNGDGEEEEEQLGEEDVEKLGRMMLKLQAVRDNMTTAGMPEEQRRRMAKRAVEEVMKEL